MAMCAIRNCVHCVVGYYYFVDAAVISVKKEIHCFQQSYNRSHGMTISHTRTFAHTSSARTHIHNTRKRTQTHYAVDRMDVLPANTWYCTV